MLSFVAASPRRAPVPERVFCESLGRDRARSSNGAGAPLPHASMDEEDEDGVVIPRTADEIPDVVHFGELGAAHLSLIHI